MIRYVFDSGPLIDMFRHYYRERFPSFWSRFDDLIEDGVITSTREVRTELLQGNDALKDWSRQNPPVFPVPTSRELRMVRTILSVPRFDSLIARKNILQGRPVADPFVIARAACLDAAQVVTTETRRFGAVRIPDVCDHFDVLCVGVEGFMEREGWRF